MTPRFDTRRLLLLVACWAIGIALWNTPWILPLKLLVVMMHESGHAIAALLIGGSVERVTVASNEGGSCLSSLPPGALGQIAVYSAGYVGSSIAGGLLLVATFRWGLRRSVLAAAAVWLTVMTVAYARDLFTAGFCLSMAAALGLAAWKLPDGGVEAINVFLAAFSTLYAVADLRDDLWDGAVRSQSDAALLAHLTYVPAIIWAALWTVASFAVLGLLGAWALRGRNPSAGPPLKLATPVH